MRVKLYGRDGAGRLMKVKLNSGRVMTTPTFFPVYNPHLPVITPEEIKKEFGWNEIITNAYIFWRDRRLYSEAKEKGIHRVLNFDGVVMMDSGAYQIWQYGEIEITNREAIEFQNEIKPDIGTFIDIVMPHNIEYEKAYEGVTKTIKHAKECVEIGSEEVSWVATVQGSVYEDLIRSSAEMLRELSFPYYALGSLKIATSQWLFKPQVKYVVEALKILPRSRPVHFWGLGHPATFSLFVLMGLDTFDSASYALYAKDDRIMYPWGTVRLDELEEFTFYSPYLEKYTPQELRNVSKEERERIIAKHNLWVILSEIKSIREAIRGEYLFELVQERVRSHPGLYKAYEYLLKNYGSYLEEYTPFSKKHGLFVVDNLFKERPEVKRALRIVKKLNSTKTLNHPVYGKIPATLLYTYPFGQTVYGDEDMVVPSTEPEEQVRDIIRYQWGVEIGEVNVEVRNGRPRKVYKDGKYIGMIRPYDGLFVPSVEGAELLKNMLPFPKGRVVVDEVAKDPVSEGRSVFTKFVMDIDPDLIPGQEVIVVDENDRVLSVGKLVLNPREVEEFEEHVAVKVRHGTKNRQS